MLEYGFIYRVGEKRLVSTVTHGCCFGSLPTPMSNVPHGGKVEDGKFILSMDVPEADFKKWFGRLVKDFPTYTVNGVKYKAPKAAFYSATSGRFGSIYNSVRTQSGPQRVSPLKSSKGRNYIIATFPKGQTVDILYIGLKFYFKNLINPAHSTRKQLTHDLWAKAEEKLIAAGIEKPTMGMIMALNSIADIRNTLGYGWPISSGKMWKKGLSRFLRNEYVTVGFQELKGNLMGGDTRGFNMYNGKSTVAGVSGWSPKDFLDDVENPAACHGYNDAIDRIKWALDL